MNSLMSRSWRPAEVKLVPSLLRPSYSLGQPLGGLLQVIVTDTGGRPVSNVTVEASRGSQVEASALTDSHGRAFLDIPPGTYDVRAIHDGMVVGERVTEEQFARGMTSFLQFPICVADPLIRPIDLIILGTSAAMITAGSYWKIKPLEMAGEIAFGAGLFGFIYRLQCL